MKTKSPRQTVCNEPTEKAKQAYCGGKLKLITPLEPKISASVAKDLDVFRCQECGEVYSEISPYAQVRGKGRRRA